MQRAAINYGLFLGPAPEASQQLYEILFGDSFAFPGEQPGDQLVVKPMVGGPRASTA